MTSIALQIVGVSWRANASSNDAGSGADAEFVTGVFSNRSGAIVSTSGVDLTFAAQVAASSKKRMSNPKLHWNLMFATGPHNSNIRKSVRRNGMQMLELDQLPYRRPAWKRQNVLRRRAAGSRFFTDGSKRTIDSVQAGRTIVLCVSDRGYEWRG